MIAASSQKKDDQTRTYKLTIMEKVRIQKLADRVININSQLGAALQELSVEATRIYGKPLAANLCNWGEIEFRLSDDDGYIIDALEIEVRLETLIEKSKDI